MADKKSKTTSSKKSATRKKKPAAPKPPPVTREDLQAALSAAQLAKEQVHYFERRLRSARSHDSGSIRKGLVASAEENLSRAKSNYEKLHDDYLQVKTKLYEGQYQRGW